ncbi:tripartite tricarboxylate transporter substrate-binding protein [Mycoplana rhizolycopersici]|uniref:Tripartite tricarboxylate transporter substrate binding protein n=1 Tax=Mycoplana rhizolycopersici TaxID=2746702 RepID=A0ABX2QL59_9HYPH|nr:tripartite tricarboxylate transporter substrate binding protein [Rhizobium rhizolycopersici]
MFKYIVSSAIVAMTAVSLNAKQALAQDYPDRPIQLIVPYSAGGAVDFVARTLARDLSIKLGQPVVVENRGGASGNIGSQAVARSRPDGYTILMSSVTSTTLTSLMQETAMGFDYQNDFVPVAVVGEIPTVLVVNKDFPAQTADELIVAAKGGAKISYASTGVGSVEHLAMELFQQLTNTELLHVPYDGAAPGIADVAGGHVAAMIATIPTALSQIEGGTVRSLLVASDKRLDKLPDTPTASEVGLEGMNVASMYAVLAPNEVDRKTLDKLNAALTEITSDEKYRTTMAERGIEPITTSLEEASARFGGEFDKWKRVVETNNVTGK